MAVDSDVSSVSCRTRKVEFVPSRASGTSGAASRGHARSFFWITTSLGNQIGVRIAEIRDGRFAVSFTQGINARCLTDEAAEAIASVDYRNDSMDTRRIYTAWDNRGDEERLFAGLNRLVKYGVKPDHIMVYMLVGYWPAETQEDRDYRRRRLREFGRDPTPCRTRTPRRRLSEVGGWRLRQEDFLGGLESE